MTVRRRTPPPVSPPMPDDGAERLMTHYVGGAWRVPFGTRSRPALAADGRRAGTLVLAEAADLDRAVAAAQAALPAWSAAGSAARCAALLAVPGFGKGGSAQWVRTLSTGDTRQDVTALVLRAAAPSGFALRAALRALAGGATLVAMPCGPGSTAAHDLVLRAHLVGLPPGVVNLLPGDAAAAAALAAHPGTGTVLQFGAGR